MYEHTGHKHLVCGSEKVLDKVIDPPGLIVVDDSLSPPNVYPKLILYQSFKWCMLLPEMCLFTTHCYVMAILLFSVQELSNCRSGCLVTEFVAP